MLKTEKIEVGNYVKVEVDRNWTPAFIDKMIESSAFFYDKGRQVGQVIAIDGSMAIVKFGKGLKGCLEIYKGNLKLIQD